MANHLKFDEPHDIHISVVPTARPALEECPDWRTRLRATGRIWGFAGSILLGSFMTWLGQGHVVTIGVLAGAAVATAAAWGAFGNRQSKALPPSSRIQELEERLANVETIVSYEERVMENKLRGLSESVALTK